MAPETPDRPASEGAPEPDSHGLDGIVAGFVDRLNAGEMLDRGVIRREHPTLADEIWSRLEVFQGLARESGPILGTLGDYTIHRRIGRGGMGVVYEARQNSLDRQVALKVLPAALAAEDKAFGRFMREAKATAKLDHPNVVKVYGVGVEQGTPYFAMEFVEGETLASLLERDDPAAERAAFGTTREDAAFYSTVAGWFAAVADGLQHAHSRGVIHRDLKPSNLILDRSGRLRILDFGLARLEGHEALTLTGDFLGTPLYMSPELARRRTTPIDHRTDIYSLGATLYEVVAGRPPFRGRDCQDTLRQIIEWDAPEPRRLNPRLPRNLETVLLKCLRKDPAGRYGTAEALAQDLTRFARGEPVEARPETAPERWIRFLRRHRLVLGAAGVLVAALVLLTLLSGLLIWREGERTRAALRDARANLEVSLEAVRRFLAWVGDEGLANVPEVGPVRRGMLRDAVELQKQLLQSGRADPVLRLRSAQLYAQAGRVYELVGERTPAGEAYRESIALLEELAREEPGNGLYRSELDAVRSLESLLGKAGLPPRGILATRYVVEGGGGVVDVEVADLDRDGRREILAVNRKPGTVTVLRATANREYSPAGTLRVGADPYQVAVFDVDGRDGPDIVAMGKGSGSISILRNKGDGTFREAESLRPESQLFAMSFADLTGDGVPEIVAAGRSLHVVARGPSGDFEARTPIAVEGHANSLAVADLDGDGRLDLAVGCADEKRLGTVSLFWNRADASAFEEAVTPSGAVAGSMAAADLDGDGDIDLALSDWHGGGVAILLNDRGRAFRPGSRVPVGPRELLVAAADLDGDLFPDLLLTNEVKGTATILLNGGSGHFPDAATFSTGGPAFLGRVVDLDGDGAKDIVLANGTADDVAVMFDVKGLLTRVRARSH